MPRQTVHRIAPVTTLQIYVGADNRFGNAINAMRTVRELEQASAASACRRSSSWRDASRQRTGRPRPAEPHPAR
ncbi:MAG: hypothetical protein IT307_01685, partial [Chloroflexi bacterium]|nr:hypothetical protein [Chloroflexota bacterium]